LRARVVTEKIAVILPLASLFTTPTTGETKRDHDDPIAFLIFAFFFCATNYVNFLSFSKNSMHGRIF